MIDINLIRENPDLIRSNIQKKFQEERLIIVDEILDLDKKWRKLKFDEDNLRKQRNSISKNINELKKAGKKADKELKQAKKIPEEIEKIEIKRKKLEKDIDYLLRQIPNIMHESVPKGEGENKNVEIKRVGKIEKKNFKVKNHVEVIEKLELGDFDAGRSSAGQGFNYLIGELAELDHALQRYGIDFLKSRGFIPVVPPMMLNYETLLGAVNGLEDFEEVVYKIEKENLYLIGTAEHSLVSMFKNKTLNSKDLPKRFCAVTPCFRKEIGSHGVDTKGLYRMHQFNKVEQVIFSKPEDSFKIMEEMQKITEEFFTNLGIPFRVIEICSGDLGSKFAKQYDIEAWFPRQDKYGEVTSAGNCTDFQSRALNIRFDEKGEKKYPHILNNTMVATSRAMVAIIENFQNKDGTIDIPLVLQKYMRGKNKIGLKDEY